MIPSLRRVSFTVLALALAFLATSCWSRREINDLAIVTAVGVDRLPEEDKGAWRFIVEIPRPRDQGGSPGGGGTAMVDTRPFLTAATTGETIWEAERNFATQSSRKLFLGQSNIAIIGHEAARQGIFPIIDFFLRKGDFRLNGWVVLTGVEALDILRAPGAQEQTPAQELFGMIANAVRHSKTVPVDLLDVARVMVAEGRDPLIPRVEPIRDPEGKLPGTGGRSDPSGSLRLGGSGMFREDRLVGWLDPAETRGANRLLGETDSGVITVHSPDIGKASVEILRSSTTVKVSLEGDTVRVSVKLVELGSAGELYDPSVDLSQSEVVRDLEAAFAQAAEDEMRAAVKKAQSAGSDVFGFGERLARHDPDAWRRTSSRWRDHYFPRAQVTYDIRTTLVTTQQILHPTGVWRQIGGDG
ncbi:MAG: Ger(x)C family spore germination protein [Bacillota bacterium]